MAAHNILVALRGGTPRIFDFKGLGKMGSLGHRSAVAEAFGFKLSGFIAWWMWRTVYWLKLPSIERRLRVAVDWTLDLAFPPDTVKLGSGRAHQDELDHAGPEHDAAHADPNARAVAVTTVASRAES